MKNKKMLLVIILLSFCWRTITCACFHDFCIGALFDITEATPNKPTIQCEKIHEVRGIQRIEAALMAIELIKKKNEILQGVTFGLEIVDTCRISNLALYKTVFLVENIIRDMREKAEKQYETHINRISHGFMGMATSSTVIGIMGPDTTDEITEVQNLLKLFNIPHIGYSDLIPDYDDKREYSTFVRVLSCKAHQANVIRDVLKEYNWSYVSAIYTNENKLLMKMFRELLKEECNNTTPVMCIANEISIRSFHNETFYHSAFNELEKSRSNVIVCFCENYVLRKIFQTIKELNLTDRFTIVASDTWENRDQITHGLEEEIWGSIFIHVKSSPIPAFSKHYTSLKPSNASENIWFNEFWEDKFDCIVPEQFKNNTNYITSHMKMIFNSSRKFCTGNESLATDYQEQRKIGFVMKAVWAMAHALHNMLQEICGINYSGVCYKILPFDHSKLLSHLKNLSFRYDDEIVSIDKDGIPIKRYEIQNYQKLPNNTFQLVHIGKWEDEKLEIFGKFQSKGNKTVTSICSLPCTLGQYRIFTYNNNDQNCCWVCKSCNDHEYVSPDGESCVKCLQDERPNANRTACDKIPYLQRDWSEAESIMVVSFATTGLFFTFITYGVFIKYKNTPIVKSSNWELSNLILFSMILSHTSVFFIMATPTTLICILSRILPGVAFTIMFASLFIKTRRIAQILAGSKKKFPKKQYKLMSIPIQVAISLFHAAIEVVICLMAMIIYPPQPETEYSSEGYPSFTCTKSSLSAIIPYIFIVYLLVLCTVYAIKARNIPGNFNEAKFIGFAILISIIIWTAFYPIFFCTSYKVITTSMCITLTASTTMVFLFFPKLYIIIFKPELNNRALFITNKSLRTHIGTSAGGKQSYLDNPPIYIIHDMNFGNSEDGCKLRSVAVQTSSKLVPDKEIFYNKHETLSIEQSHSSSVDDEFISDDDNQFDSQQKSVSTSVEVENDNSINRPSNDIFKSKEKLSSMATALLTTKLDSLRDKRVINLTNNIRSVPMNIKNLLQNNNTRGGLQLKNHNLELNGNENVPKKIQQNNHEVKHTRIHEVQTRELHNGDPIFNITISLSPDA